MVKAVVQKIFDKYFFGIVLIICIIGLFSFISASLGILAHNASKFYSVIFSQLVIGYTAGFVALFLALKLPYSFLKKYAFYIFMGAVMMTLLVFVPHIGFAHGGARRWINLGFTTFQPAEFLKIAFVIYFSAWLSWMDKKKKDNNFKIIPLVVLFAVSALSLLFQPDTKSLLLILASGIVMVFVSGIPWKTIALIGASVLIGFGILIMVRPYVMNRIKTFVDPSSDPQGSSYQLKQGLIAIGSGGMFGRGLGQSVQKFNYLPEPQGDSIFAVYGEEFGFVGTMLLVVLYVFFAIRGYKIAFNATDSFARFLVIGLVTMLTAQTFLNIASIVGLFPLTGVPLVFISQGGTALMFALASVGIILNISKYNNNV